MKILKKDPKRVSAAPNGMKVRMDARRVADWRSGGRMLRKLERNYFTKCAPREVNVEGLVNECDLLTKIFFNESARFLVHACEITCKMYY